MAGRDAFCPLCRAYIEDITKIINAISRAEAEAADAELEHVRGEFGTKLTFMLSRLLEIRRTEGPQVKSIVFSQWARLLTLVADALKVNDFRYSYLSGKNREEELDQFRNDPDCTVLLVSLRSGGGAAGLTLTMATYGFIMEPSLNVRVRIFPCCV